MGAHQAALPFWSFPISGAGYLESRPTKPACRLAGRKREKEGGGRKWAMTVESGTPPIGARIGEKGVEKKAAERRKKVRERPG